LSFAERVRRRNTECGFMYGEGALKMRFLKRVHQAAHATVRERNTSGITMAELARVDQTTGDENRRLARRGQFRPGPGARQEDTRDPTACRGRRDRLYLVLLAVMTPARGRHARRTQGQNGYLALAAGLTFSLAQR